jgi:hypothetical protein
MSSSTEKPIGQFEFELTNELAARAGLALLQFQSLRLRKPHSRKALSYPRLLLVLGLSLLLLALSYLRKQPDISLREWIISDWILFTPLALLVFCFLLLAVLTAFTRLVGWLGSLVPWLFVRRARKLAHRRIEYVLYEDRFERRTADGARVFPWGTVREAHAVPEFWFLVLKSRRTVCIPSAVLSAEIQSLISRKVAEAGVKFEEWALPPLQVEQN